MKILIDTNILLDIALRREPFFGDSVRVLDWAESNPQQAAIAWHTVSNVAYLLKQDARGFLSDLLLFVEVAAGSTSTVRQALMMQTPDVEDALQVGAAITFGADLVVTRDVSDYKRLPIKVITPSGFASQYL
jgi:predicted nucleic acid-binding protein